MPNHEVGPSVPSARSLRLSFNSNATHAVVLWKTALVMPTDLSKQKEKLRRDDMIVESSEVRHDQS